MAPEEGLLTMRDLQWVLKAVWPARTQWWKIGLGVGLEVDDLENIEGSDNGSRLTNMLTVWLRRQESLSPSREKLVKALKSRTVQREDIAHNLTGRDPTLGDGDPNGRDPTLEDGDPTPEDGDPNGRDPTLEDKDPTPEDGDPNDRDPTLEDGDPNIQPWPVLLRKLKKVCTVVFVTAILALIVAVLAALIVPNLTQLSWSPETHVHVAVNEHLYGNTTTDSCNSSSEVVCNGTQKDDIGLGPNNLPSLPGPFIGRYKDIENITDILLGRRYSWAKIVGIYGLPTVGKSTLAIQVGYEMVHRGITVRHINLNDANIEYLLDERQRKHAPSTVPGGEPDGSGVATRYGDIGVPVDESIGEEQHKTATTSGLLEWAASVKSETLLILDNCDHILEGNTSVDLSRTVTELIQASPFLHVLTTSRYQLFIVNGFMGYELRNLSDQDAVELLQFKAPILHSDAETIAGLVGNLPLALNLISGLLLSYNIPVSEVIVQLQQSPLIHDVHHDLFKFSQEIHQALSMSYKYLDEPTQECSYYLTIFPGSFSDAAAVTVLNDTVNTKHCLKRLKELSLIDQYRYAGECRYQLHTLVREFFKRPSDLFQPPSLGDTIRCSFRLYYSQFLLGLVKDHAGPKELGDSEGIGRFEYETHNFRLLTFLVNCSHPMQIAEEACRGTVHFDLYAAIEEDINNLLLLVLTREDLVDILWLYMMPANWMFLNTLAFKKLTIHAYATVNKYQNWNAFPIFECPQIGSYSQHCCSRRSPHPPLSHSRWYACYVRQQSHYIFAVILHRGTQTCFPLCLRENTWLIVYLVVAVVVWTAGCYSTGGHAIGIIGSCHIIVTVVLFWYDYQFTHLTLLVYISIWLIHIYFYLSKIMVVPHQSHDLLFALCFASFPALFTSVHVFVIPYVYTLLYSVLVDNDTALLYLGKFDEVVLP